MPFFRLELPALAAEDKDLAKRLRGRHGDADSSDYAPSKGSYGARIALLQSACRAFKLEGILVNRARLRMGRLDHVHIRVPNREEAARWYAEYLGFEPVERFDFWASGFEGGPLQISADGGRTMLALFEASEGHPMTPQALGVAFSFDADGFIAFARSLPCGIAGPSGQPLELRDIVDFDMCWAFSLVDPWGNQYELNCYEYDRIKTDLIETDGIEPERYWPRELFKAYRSR